MKKKLSLLAALLFILININAQDFIYKRNQSERIAVKNTKVHASETTYKLYGEESGIEYTINNKQISMIAFENGDIRFFEREKKVINRHNYKKNIINYHLFDLVVNNFKLSYERIISKGKIGIQIPFAIGYGSDDQISGFDDVYNTFYSGITINFYPTGQGTVRYFMGPSIQIGTGYFQGDWNEYTRQYDHINTMVFRFLINNGIVFTPIDALSISLVGSLGIRSTDKTKKETDNNVKTVGAFAANLSYRF
ncbi:MAG: hypothetical protein QM503_12915 [Bacteroidota bacterium]